jgi:hypothetical protein
MSLTAHTPVVQMIDIKTYCTTRGARRQPGTGRGKRLK